MSNQLDRLTTITLGAFIAVALALGYWALLRAPDILAREDNPRLVEQEQAIARGALLDRAGRPLAESILQDGAYARVYPHPQAAPATGYYSLRYGVGGIEATFDTTLRGDAGYSDWDQLLHHTQRGGDVRLTLDLDVQTAVADAMKGQTGAAVVIDAETGAVLALVSSPTFDPNTLDDNWDALTEDPAAPLLNRAIQGQYQPGGVLQTVVLAAALQSDVLPPFDAASAADPVALALNGESITLRCAYPPSAPLADLYAAYVHACPAPFAEVGQALGAQRLEGAFAGFGLLEPPPLLDRADISPAPSAAAIADPVAASLGQGALTVSPAQMVRVAAAVVNGGDLPALYVVSHTRAAGGAWVDEPVPAPVGGVLSRGVARQVREAMQSGEDEDTELIGHAALALSGFGDGVLAWFIGAREGNGGRAWAVAVVLEDAAGVDEAARIGALALGAAEGMED